MENQKVEKQTPNPQTTNPKTIEIENPKEEKPTQTPQTNTSVNFHSLPVYPPDSKTTEMENPKEEKPTQNSQTIKPESELKNLDQPKTTKHVVWDCESSLYDSFELKSFERQLDSAISARTLSMPHLSDHRKPPPPPPQPSKKPSKISRSLQKFFRSVFRPKQSNNRINNSDNNSKSSSWFRVEKGSREGVYYVYDTSGALTTIPEVPETFGGGDFDGLSPELKSFVRRTASDRFAPASLGISCA